MLIQGRTIPEGNIRGGAKRSLVAWFESGKRRIFQRCVPQAERDVHSVREIWLRHVKYACGRVGIYFISHCDRREQYFTIYEVNYFTFGFAEYFT